MSEAPERIWTANTEGKCHVGFYTPSMNYANEYVRADILAQTLAANAALVKRLDEARRVIGAAWLQLTCLLAELEEYAVEASGESYNAPLANDALAAAHAFLAGGE